MDKETIDRVAAAPKEILVQVTAAHIKQCLGSRPFLMEFNPISIALQELGWTAVSIGNFNAFVGHPGEQVCYKPEVRTTDWIQSSRRGDWGQPFIAGFKKETL